MKKLTPARRRALLWIKENEPVSMFPLDGSAPSLTFVKRLVGEMLVEKVGQRNMGRYGFTQYGLSPAGRAALEDGK